MCDAHMDELFTAEISELDTSVRLQKFYELSRYMTENVYFLGLYEDSGFTAYSPRLTGVVLAEPNQFYTIAQWDLKP